ncbi:MAG: HDOD domain-containing protein [Sulfurospirillaceae bacterium]|nr:HDOD domain-containing protein [Sulfurospirillaceae bacterium]
MIHDIVDRIRSLPPLPKSFQSINEICENPNSGINELAKVIETDPMLVANLLKIANSPLYSFQREIKSVLQAISLFGMSSTRSLVTSISVKKLLNVDMEPYGVTPEEFVHISTIQSALVAKWYRKINSSMADDLFLAALLQDTGKILIADEIVRSDEVYHFSSEIKTTNDVTSVEKMYVGASTADVTSEIFEHWGFSEKMVNMIKFSDHYEEAEDLREYAKVLKILKTAVPINNPLAETSINRACKILESENMSVKEFLNAVEEIKN